MSDPDFLPQSETELSNWLANFSSVLPEVGPLVGLKPAEISSLNALITSVMDDIQTGKSKEKQSKKEAMISFLDLIVYRIRRHPSYNENEHGTRLGLI